MGIGCAIGPGDKCFEEYVNIKCKENITSTSKPSAANENVTSKHDNHENMTISHSIVTINITDGIQESKQGMNENKTSLLLSTKDDTENTTRWISTFWTTKLTNATSEQLIGSRNENLENRIAKNISEYFDINEQSGESDSESVFFPD